MKHLLGHGMKPFCSIRRWGSTIKEAPLSFATSTSGVVVQDLGKWWKRPVPINAGPGGRSSVTGRVVTVFGCTGFLGQYIVHQLAKQGNTVIVPFRGDDDTIRDLKVMGDLGQILPFRFDLESPEQIMECIKGAHVVVNCIAKDYETLRFTMEQVNVDGAARIARACKLQKEPPRLIHISCMKSHKASSSQFMRTKAMGEERVLSEFPQATIIRTSILYGYEDRFLNAFGQLYANGFGIIPVVKGKSPGPEFFQSNPNAMNKQSLNPHEKQPFYPLYVGDAAYGINSIIQSSDIDFSKAFMGSTIQFYGPEKYNMERLVDLFNRVLVKQPKLVHMPVWMYRALGLWMMKWKRAQWKSDQIKQWTMPEFIDPLLPSLQEFSGMKPLARLEDRILEFMRQYRHHLDFNDPMAATTQKNTSL
jgi:nucleoside-diphosphate-sugar epimerase